MKPKTPPCTSGFSAPKPSRSSEKRLTRTGGPKRVLFARAFPALSGCALIFGITLAAACAAWAQTPIDDTLDQRSAKRLDQMEKVVKELRAIVFQGRDTGQPIVIQPADTDGRLNTVDERLDTLDRTLATLTGEIEIVRHDLDQAQKQDVDLAAKVSSLEARLTAVEQALKAQAPPPPPPPPTSDSTTSSPAQTPDAAYQAARAAFLAGDNASAESQFQAFVQRYGDTPRAPEARYYLGRALMARKDWPEAATSDIGAIRGWPQTSWAPAAVLDLSRDLHEMGRNPDACETLDELSRRYPQADRQIRRDALVLRHESKCG